MSKKSPHAKIVEPAAPWMSRPTITMPPLVDRPMAGPDAASGVDRRDVRVVVDGHVVPSDPKNHERREVPVPRFLIDELAAQVAGKASDALVFGGEKAGTPMRSRTFQRAVFDEASAHATDVACAASRNCNVRRMASAPW